MKKKNKGFVVSAILYPLLVLFLALIMGLLAMTDTRKRILDKMKLEISDSIFDDAECSCDTILNKLNYLIKNGVGGGGGGGSYAYNVLGLNVKGYETEDDIPNTGNAIGDIAVITDVEVTSYYVSLTPPKDPKDGNVWIVQDTTSVYHIKSDYSNIGISYVMQYIEEKWVLKKAYVFDDGKWKLLYYVSIKDGIVDFSSTDVNAELIHNYGYTGKYQKFKSVFAGYYTIELWGAQGGTMGGVGGLGAYTKGEIYLNAGETLYVYVGGAGTGGSDVAGGWNGGGNAGPYGSNYYGSSGGGSTDIRLVNTSDETIWNEFESIKSRIMVAAGGGGGGYYGSSYVGGQPGGGVTGFNGNGVAGTQTLGSGFGYGGSGNSYGGPGGGGGYYGGSGTSYGTHSAASGSSYISGYVGCNSIGEDSISTDIVHTGNIHHYSDYYFINTKMVDGGGYEWNSVGRNNYSKMPAYNSSNLIDGNTGNGYARISIRTVEIIDQKDITTLQDAGKNEWRYSYQGKYQTFSSPFSGYYTVELWGAQGGTNGGGGGLGAYTKGEIYLGEGEKLYIYVGGVGVGGSGTAGGWNGGGNAGPYGSNYYGSSGGGSTDARLTKTSSSTSWNEFESLKSRIMVAAGGAGGGYYGSNYVGGQSGGGITGFNGTATAGTQTLGSGFGYAGSGNSYGGNGGGGGYYGGGGTSYSTHTAASGSSYISGHAGCNSLSEDSTSNSLVHIGTAYHYSGYYFINTKMVDGTGYQWEKTYRSNQSNMPSLSSSSTMTGNSGYGYAKITLKEKIKKTKAEIQSLQQEFERDWNYSYQGRYQIFTSPFAGYYQMELWGAQGGTNGGGGGLGAYTKGTIYLNRGETLYVYVGGVGVGGSGTAGGWNGGGNAGPYGSNYYGSSAGGSTDIRVQSSSAYQLWNDTKSLISRIMVAAGGAGGGYYGSSYVSGQPGGGLTGFNGNGTAGTQISGAGFGYGGNGCCYGGNAGSGGWYGGIGTSYGTHSAASGSSYISGHAGCIGVDSSGEKKTSTYSTIDDSVSYTGYRFTETSIIDGAGYPWTTSRHAVASNMVSPMSLSNQTGQSGHGYARVTYLGA